MERVFLSYRRSDSGIFATELGPILAEELDVDVFLDVENILPGANWDTKITAVLEACRVVIVILGDNWVGWQFDASGRRRIDDEHDVLRLEISKALASDAQVIPVLIGNTPSLHLADLPSGIAGLADRQHLVIDLTRREASIKFLIATVRHYLEEVSKHETPSTEGVEEPKALFDWGPPYDPAAAGSYSAMVHELLRRSPQFAIALRTSMITGRPLVLTGSSARVRHLSSALVARSFGFRLYEYSCNHQSRANDLAYQFDLTRRLADAQSPNSSVRRQLYRAGAILVGA